MTEQMAPEPPPEEASDTGQNEERTWRPGGRLQLETFAEHLLDAAGRVMEHEYPEWTRRLKAAVESGTDLEEATKAPPPDGSDKTLADYRALLGQLFDVHQGILQFRRAWRLQSTLLSTDALEQLKMTAGEWWWYHEEAWSVMMFAVSDRADALVKATFRDLRGGRDARGQYVTEKRLVGVLAALKKRAAAVRHPVAHGVHAGDRHAGRTGQIGPVTGIAEAGLWEHLSVLRLWSPPNFALNVFGNAADIERRAGERFRVSLQVIGAVDTVIGQLDEAIDWDYVNSPKPQPRAAKSGRATK